RMLLLSQGQRLQSLQKHKGIERAQAWAEVAQQLNARFDDEGHVAQPWKISKHFPVPQSMVTRVRFGQVRELPIIPFELAGIHDDAADRSAMPPNVFRRRIDHNIR